MLDDVVHLQSRTGILHCGFGQDFTGHIFVVELQPFLRFEIFERGFSLSNVFGGALCGVDADSVPRRQLIRGNGNFLSVHRQKTVGSKLTSLRAAGTKSQPVSDIVEAQLQKLQQNLRRECFGAHAVFHIPAKLPLVDEVHPFRLLFFQKLSAVFGTADAVLTVHPRRIVAFLEIFDVLIPQGLADPPCQPGFRSCPSHTR